MEQSNPVEAYCIKPVVEKSPPMSNANKKTAVIGAVTLAALNFGAGVYMGALENNIPGAPGLAEVMVGLTVFTGINAGLAGIVATLDPNDSLADRMAGAYVNGIPAALGAGLASLFIFNTGYAFGRYITKYS